jgi:hypothetical protein
MRAVSEQQWVPSDEEISELLAEYVNETGAYSSDDGSAERQLIEKIWRASPAPACVEALEKLLSMGQPECDFVYQARAALRQVRRKEATDG